MFFQLFIAVLLIIGLPITLWIWTDGNRRKKHGCSGNHDCVVYKGERIMCPSCELKEQQKAAAPTACGTDGCPSAK